MKLYGGIDLHSNNSVASLLDGEDRVVYHRRLAAEAQAVLEALAPYREAIAGLVVESIYNWYWLVDALTDAGYRVHLANTAAIVQYSGLKYSDDDSDVCWLAKLLLATPLHAFTKTNIRAVLTLGRASPEERSPGPRWPMPCQVRQDGQSCRALLLGAR
jgi:hypothetical protein